MKLQSEAGYNERLFASSVRRGFHLARFEWVRSALVRAGARCESVLELGCFDGRAVAYLPRRPGRYLGLDANWEGGLDLARERTAADPSLEFRTCTTPAELRDLTSGSRFDTAICLETLEHVPPDRVSDYLAAISEVLDGHIAITVPNEKGAVFLAKYLVKRAVGEVPEYRLAEIGAATIGRMDRVARREHKGFDYDRVVEAGATHFDLIEVSGYPVRSLPKMLGFGVGILARSRVKVSYNNGLQLTSSASRPRMRTS